MGALFSESGFEEAGKRLIEIPIDGIRPNPYQPRIDFDDGRIQELADSIGEKGILQPLIVSKRDDGYELVVGERRLRAARAAGLTEVPCLVLEVPDEEVLEVALVENLQREDLDPVEEARAYTMMVEKFGLSQEEVARRVGKGRATVTNALRLLKLPAEIQRLLREGKLSAGHARTLIGIEDPGEQVRTANDLVNKGLSVREAEETRRGKEGSGEALGQRRGRRSVDPRVRRVEEELQRYFGTFVKVRGSNKGTIVIKYYSIEDLNRILDILGIEV